VATSTEPAIAVVESAPAAARHPVVETLRALLRHRLGAPGFVVLVLIAAVALLAPWIAPHDPAELDYDAVLAPPGWPYLLGTDEIGRDVLSRIIYGASISLQVVVTAIGAALLLGSAIGLIAGYYGGWIDDVAMRIMDGLLAFPMIILALGIIAVLGPDLTNAIIAITIVNIPGFARLVRGQVLALREREFVQAVRVMGQTDALIMLRHVWPAVSGNVVVYASLKASTSLITESALAFLGLGAQPPTPTWGSMLSTAMQYGDAWWLSVFPGAAIFVTVLALNFLGDGLRDVLDTRLERPR